MAHETVSEEPRQNKTIDAKPLPDVPMIIGVSREQVGKINIGDTIRFLAKGEIAGIREATNTDPQAAQIMIEIRSPQVLEVEANTADMAMKKILETK